MLDKRTLLLALFLLLFVGGCTNPSWTTAGKIVSPVYEVCPLEGKWSVIEEFGSDGYSVQTSLDAPGSFFQFSREAAIINSNVWNQPAYKIKKVNATDYLATRHTVLNTDLALTSKKVEVVTVFADSNYLGEFMKINDSEVVSFVQNKVLLIHKMAAHADDPGSISNASVDDTDQYNKTGTSGIFIGLKIPANDDYIYKTVWVAAHNKKLHPVLIRNDIYFPRLSGFWELQVKQGNNRSALFAHNIAEKDLPAAEKVYDKTASSGSESIVIDYIGNDYAAIQNNTGDITRLQVLPVDKLSSPIGIKVTDLLGPAGLKAYHGAREQTVQALYSQGTTSINPDSDEDNYGLTRKNGHWYLQGRVNYYRNNIPGTIDFNMKFLPPVNLVVYDTLYPGWQSIKDRVPNALDAVTSPNKDIAVVKAKSKLYIFGINGEQLNSIPLGEININEGTTIIMAEWATGFYVDDWEKNFLTNGATVLEK